MLRLSLGEKKAREGRLEEVRGGEVGKVGKVR